MKNDPPDKIPLPPPKGTAVGNVNFAVFFDLQDVEGQNNIVGQAAGFKIDKTVIKGVNGIGQKIRYGTLVIVYLPGGTVLDKVPGDKLCQFFPAAPDLLEQKPFFQPFYQRIVIH
jgi:hypothetical protein